MGGGSWKRDGKREFYEGPILQTALLKWAMRHEKRFLAGKKVQVALGSVCRQCGDCQPTCPAGVNVPELMRAHM
jgi:predicted aldo/keto reductase-like oxidoreductase